MTTRAKENWGNAMTWILRSMTAVGAMFLIDMHDDFRKMKEDVNHALNRQEIQQVQLDTHSSLLKEHSRTLARLQHIVYDGEQ